MRRTDREITDPAALLAVIDRCDVMRIGLSDGDFPYIVPVNFAWEQQGDTLVFYIHGAAAGRKYELLGKNGVCSFEMDLPGEIVPSPGGGITTHYRSVMGTARAEFLEGAEKVRVLNEVLMQRWPVSRGIRCGEESISHTAAVKLTVLSMTGKSNPALPRE